MAYSPRPAPLYSDTYDGPRWTYGLTRRPAGYATVPDGWLVGSLRGAAGFGFGTVDYPRELAPAEVAGFELTPVAASA